MAATMNKAEPLSSARRLPHIWVITPEFHRRGGTERSLVEQVARWSADFDLRVYSSVSGADALPTRHVPRLPGPQLLRFVSWFAANRVIRGSDAVRDGHPEAVVSPGINAMDADAIGVHMIFGQHAEARSDDPEGLAKRVHRWLYFRLLILLEARVYAGPATIWAVSAQDARELESRFARPPGSVPVVHHGVDTEAFSPARRETLRASAREFRGVANRKVVLVIGNDIVKKGVDIAIRSMTQLPSHVILAVGGLVDPDAVASLASRAGVADRVQSWGHVGDPVELFAAADLLIAPSREEAFGLPVLEAMACGVPVIVSAAAGVSELLTNQEDSVVLRDAENDVELAAAISAILDDRQRTDALIVAAAKRASALTWKESADRAAAIVEGEIATPRLLVLATDAGRSGGIQRVTRTLARAAGDAFGEERVGVLSVWRGEAPFSGRELRAGAAPVGDGRVGPIRSASFVLDAVVAARRWRRRLAIVVSHPHLAPVGWLSRVVSRAPYAVWCHGIEVWGPLDRATRFGLRRADQVFAPSRFTATQVEVRAGLPTGSVAVVPHCVAPELHPDAIEPATRLRGRVLTVARLHPDHAYKGVDTLLEAWASVVRAVAEATLLVVGEGPDRSRLERRARALGVSESVTFAGRLSDRELARAYAMSSMFAMPARHRTGSVAEGEGFGLVFIEAGAAGLPVVAGVGGGADEAVEHEVSGLLVDALDLGSVSNAIIRVLSEPDLAERLGAGGRHLAETRFSYGNFAKSSSELIRSMPIRDLVR